LMARLSRWLEDKGLDVHELCAAEVERFVGARRAEGYKKYLTSKALGPVLAYLRELRVAPTPPPPPPNGPVEVALERYRHYLTVERGLRSDRRGLRRRGAILAARQALTRRPRSGPRAAEAGRGHRLRGGPLSASEPWRG